MVPASSSPALHSADAADPLPSADHGLRGGPILFLIAGLLGAIVAVPWLIAMDGRFPPENLSMEMTDRIRADRDDPIAWAKERENRWVSLYRTAAVCLAGFGLSFGAFLGIAEGLARRSLRLLVLGAVVTGVAGGAFAAAGGVAEAALLMQLETSGLDLTLRTMAGHGLAWAFVAAGVGIGLAVSLRQFRLALPLAGQGVAGGLIAGLLYSPLAALFFQLERSDLPIPEGGWNKMLFAGLAAGLMAVAIGRGARTSLRSGSEPGGPSSNAQEA